MSAWDLVEKSPAVRLPIAALVADWAYVAADDAPDCARLVWAHRLDRSPPGWSGEHALDVALARWPERHPKEMAKSWSRWADARRRDIHWLRWKLALQRSPRAAQRRAALVAARRRFLAARGRAA